jgi:flagellar basal-body rod modification protein FlgD
VTSVSSVTNSGQTQANQINSVAAADDAQTRFLTLLTAQMKNQDPLSPLDNAAVTSQLAQLSTVTGVNKLNETLGSLKTGLDANAGIQAAGLIGKTVLAPSDVVQVGTGAVQFGVQPSGAAESVRVSLLDSNGALLQTLDLGASDGSVIQAQWDGKLADGTSAPPGTYTMKVSASTGGVAVDAAGLTYSKVESVAFAPSGALLRLADNRNVTVGQVSSIN